MHIMSLDRDGSKLLENCLKMIGNCRFHRFQACLGDILVHFVNTPNGPMHSGFENRRIEENQVYFNDILVSRYGNYVMQTAIDRVRQDPQLK